MPHSTLRALIVAFTPIVPAAAVAQTPAAVDAEAERKKVGCR